MRSSVPARRMWLALLGAALMSAACAEITPDGGNRAIAVRPPADPQAWIVVEATQTECCYVEGSTDVLEITNRDGFRVAELAFANKVPLSGGQFVSRFDRVPVGLGPHTVMLWQEDCGGGCSWVEGGDNTILNDAAEGPHRHDLCAITIDVVPGETVVEARWSPFVGCQSIDVQGAP